MKQKYQELIWAKQQVLVERKHGFHPLEVRKASHSKGRGVMHYVTLSLYYDRVTVKANCTQPISQLVLHRSVFIYMSMNGTINIASGTCFANMPKLDLNAHTVVYIGRKR